MANCLHVKKCDKTAIHDCLEYSVDQDMGTFRWRASHLILRCVMYELLTLTEKICGLCVLMRVFLFLSTFYNPLHYLHILVFLRHMLKIKGQNELNA